MTTERPPTLRDVAELAGVDVSLVSKLINNDPMPGIRNICSVTMAPPNSPGI